VLPHIDFCFNIYCFNLGQLGLFVGKTLVADARLVKDRKSSNGGRAITLLSVRCPSERGCN